MKGHLTKAEIQARDEKTEFWDDRKEWIEDKYFNECWTRQKIAVRLKVSNSELSYQMDRMGIEKKSRKPNKSFAPNLTSNHFRMMDWPS